MINNNQASGSNLQGNTDNNSYQAEISNTINYSGDNREQVVNPTSQRVTNYASSMINSLGFPNGMNAVPQQFIMAQAPLLQGFNGMPYPASQPMLPVFPNGMNAVPQQFIMAQAPLLQGFNGMPYPASQPMLPVFPNGVNVVPQQLVNPTSQRVTNYASSMINSLGFPNGMNVMPQQIIMSQPLSLYETNGVSHIYQSTLINSIATCKRPNTFEDESISKKQKPSERAELNEVERRFIEKCKHGDALDEFNLEDLNDLILIRDLGKFQVNINAQDENGCTALMYLSKKLINWNVIRAFKEKGADLDLVDDQGYTALIHAATWSADPLEAIYGFIKGGANLSATNKDGKNFYEICFNRNDLYTDEDIRTIYKYIYRFYEKKSPEMDLDLLKEIINSCKMDDTPSCHYFYRKILLLALRNKNYEIANFIIDGARFNFDCEEEEILTESIRRFYNLDVLKFLVENKNIAINNIKSRHWICNSPLGVAIRVRNLGAIDFLLDNKDHIYLQLDGNVAYYRYHVLYELTHEDLRQVKDTDQNPGLEILLHIMGKIPDLFTAMPFFVIRDLLREVIRSEQWELLNFIISEIGFEKLQQVYQSHPYDRSWFGSDFINFLLEKDLFFDMFPTEKQAYVFLESLPYDFNIDKLKDLKKKLTQKKHSKNVAEFFSNILEQIPKEIAARSERMQSIINDPLDRENDAGVCMLLQEMEKEIEESLQDYAHKIYLSRILPSRNKKVSFNRMPW